MIRVLVVEDDQEKLRRVAVTLTSVTGCSIDHIDTARDTTAAKRLLREIRYDLMVLDISIPMRLDQEPDRQGGLQLLAEILERDGIYHRPAHVVGLTAFDESELLAMERFRDEAFALVRYEAASQHWEETLRRKVAHVLVSKAGPDRPEYDFDVGVVTALDDPELRAVLALDWSWKQRQSDGDDGTMYHEGIAEREGTRLRVIAASAPRMGLVSSAALAMKMTMRFRPRYLAMAGIAAGVRGEVELGDILAADPCWDYESGKRQLLDGVRTFAQAPHQVAPDSIVRGSLAALARDQTALDELRRGWTMARIGASPSLRLGPVASGAAVLQDSSIVTDIRGQHRKTLGIEMESYGVMAAAAEAPAPQPRAFSIKSVCDFADELKNDGYQAYAAYTSAGALRLLVERYLPF